MQAVTAKRTGSKCCYWAAQLINPKPKNQGDGCFSLPFCSASLAIQVLQTELQSKHCHASPQHPLPCTDFPEQKLMRKEKKSCRELANLHVSESVRLQWWANSAFTAGTKEKQIWKQTDFSWGKAMHFTYGFCTVKPNSQSDFVVSKVLVKNSTFWVISCDPRTCICQLQQRNQFSSSWACWSCRFSPTERGSSIPLWLPSSQDMLSKILPQSPIPGTDMGTGRSPARCSGPSPRPAKKHQACPDKGADFPHPQKKPLAWFFHLELTVSSTSLTRAGGKRGEDLSLSLTNSFILLFLKRRKKDGKESGIPQ